MPEVANIGVLRTGYKIQRPPRVDEQWAAVGFMSNKEDRGTSSGTRFILVHPGFDLRLVRPIMNGNKSCDINVE